MIFIEQAKNTMGVNENWNWLINIVQNIFFCVKKISHTGFERHKGHFGVDCFFKKDSANM